MGGWESSAEACDGKSKSRTVFLCEWVSENVSPSPCRHDWTNVFHRNHRCGGLRQQDILFHNVGGCTVRAGFQPCSGRSKCFQRSQGQFSHVGECFAWLLQAKAKDPSRWARMVPGWDSLVTGESWRLQHQCDVHRWGSHDLFTSGATTDDLG